MNKRHTVSVTWLFVICLIVSCLFSNIDARKFASSARRGSSNKNNQNTQRIQSNGRVQKQPGASENANKYSAPDTVRLSYPGQATAPKIPQKPSAPAADGGGAAKPIGWNVQQPAGGGQLQKQAAPNTNAAPPAYSQHATHGGGAPPPYSQHGNANPHHGDAPPAYSPHGAAPPAYSPHAAAPAYGNNYPQTAYAGAGHPGNTGVVNGLPYAGGAMGVAAGRHQQNQNQQNQQQYPAQQQQYPAQQYPAQQYPAGGQQYPAQQYPGGGGAYPVGGGGGFPVGQQYPTGGQPIVNNYYQGQPQKSGGLGTFGTAAVAGIGGLALYGALKPSEQKTIIIHEGGNNGTAESPVPAAPPAAGTPPVAPGTNPDGTPLAPMPPMNPNGMPMSPPPMNPDGTPMVMPPPMNPDGTPMAMPQGVNGMPPQMAPNGQYMYPPQYPPQQNAGMIDPQNAHVPLAPFTGQPGQEQHTPLAPFPDGPPPPPPADQTAAAPVNADQIVPLAPLPPALPVCEPGQNPTDNNCTIALPANATVTLSPLAPNAPEPMPTTAVPAPATDTQPQPVKDIPVVPVAHTGVKASSSATTILTNICLLSLMLAFLAKF